MKLLSKTFATIGTVAMLCTGLPLSADSTSTAPEKHVAEVPEDTPRAYSDGSWLCCWRSEYWVYVGLVGVGLAIALTQDNNH